MKRTQHVAQINISCLLTGFHTRHNAVRPKTPCNTLNVLSQIYPRPDVYENLIPFQGQLLNVGECVLAVGSTAKLGMQ